MKNFYVNKTKKSIKTSSDHSTFLWTLYYFDNAILSIFLYFIMAYRTSYIQCVRTDVHINSMVLFVLKPIKHNRKYHKSTTYTYICHRRTLLVINIYFCPCLAKERFVRKSGNCFLTKHFIYF